MDPDLRMKLHEDTNVTNFESAKDDASSLEIIKATIGKTLVIKSPTDQFDHIFSIAENEQHHFEKIAIEVHVRNVITCIFTNLKQNNFGYEQYFLIL